MAKITPMMQQYFAIKEEYKHCLLFFRLGNYIDGKRLGTGRTGAYVRRTFS